MKSLALMLLASCGLYLPIVRPNGQPQSKAVRYCERAYNCGAFDDREDLAACVACMESVNPRYVSEWELIHSRAHETVGVDCLSAVTAFEVTNLKPCVLERWYGAE